MDPGCLRCRSLILSGLVCAGLSVATSHVLDVSFLIVEVLHPWTLLPQRVNSILFFCFSYSSYCLLPCGTRPPDPGCGWSALLLSICFSFCRALLVTRFLPSGVHCTLNEACYGVRTAEQTKALKLSCTRAHKKAQQTRRTAALRHPHCSPPHDSKCMCAAKKFPYATSVLMWHRLADLSLVMCQTHENLVSRTQHLNLYGTGVPTVRNRPPRRKAEREQLSCRVSTFLTMRCTKSGRHGVFSDLRCTRETAAATLEHTSSRSIKSIDDQIFMNFLRRRMMSSMYENGRPIKVSYATRSPRGRLVVSMEKTDLPCRLETTQCRRRARPLQSSSEIGEPSSISPGSCCRAPTSPSPTGRPPTILGL